MDLIERYIASVRVFLPKGQRDDIVQELAGDIRSQASDKEAELGRPLSTDEQATLLRQYGHPLLMAARYRSGRRYLIGPVLFPHYWQALRLVVGLIVAVNLASIGFHVVGGASFAEVGALVLQLVDSGLNSVVVITVIAACIDWSLTYSKLLERWEPTPMGPGRGARQAGVHARWAAREAGRAGGLARSAFDGAGPPVQVRSVSQFVAFMVFSVWFLLGLKFPYLVLGSAATLMDWAPVVNWLFPALLAAEVLVLTEQYLRLTGATERTFLRFMRVVWANAGWVALVLLLVSNHQWVVWIGTPEQWARYGTLIEMSGRSWSLVDLVNVVISITGVAVAFGTLIGPCSRMRRWFPHGKAVNPVNPLNPVN